MRAPVFDVRRRLLEPEQSVASGAHREAANAVAPLLLGAFELDVLVDDAGQDDGHDRIVPPHDEHDEQAEEEAEQRERPMVVFVAGAPARRFEQRLERARHVHKAIAHQEEHGD